MTMPKEIAYLIFHHFQGDLTDLEQHALQNWLNVDEKHLAFLQDLTENCRWEEELTIWHRLNNIAKKNQDDRLLITKVLDRIHAVEPELQKNKNRFLWRYVAAAIILCCLAVYFTQKQDVKQEQVLVHGDVSDIQPGGNGARLALPDGTFIALKPDDQGIRMGSEIRYTNGDKLAIKELTNQKLTNNVRLTLEVPVKNFYKIILSDGTKVWVNSGSKLHYPLRFERDKRVVELEGEAYFEVAKLFPDNNRGAKPTHIPFLVKSNGQLVEVLGTKFNVTAYLNTGTTKTTLLEGKVAVSAASVPSKSIVLTPGKQSFLDGDKFHVKEVDVEQAIAWKDGLFYFDGEDVKEAFEQLGKWYDVDIHYVGKEPRVPFFGTIERNKSLKTVVDILQKSGVKLRLERKSDRTRLMIEGE